MSLDDQIADTVRAAVSDAVAEALHHITAVERPVVLTINQAADWLQVSESTVRRKIDAGIIPVLDLGDARLVRIPVAALERLPVKRGAEP